MYDPRLPLTYCPVIKRSCSITHERSSLRIQNGPFEIRIELPAEPDRAALDLLERRPAEPDGLRRAFAMLLGTDRATAQAAVDEMTRAGIIVEHPSHAPPLYSGEYIAYRLIDTFRCRSYDTLGTSELMMKLKAGGQRELAIGFLLENYFVIASARWTATAVLSHWMTRTQRQLLEEFFTEEAGHGELLAGAFAAVDLDPALVREAEATAETKLYQRYFYSSGGLSVAHFAAAIIIPEVRDDPKGTLLPGGNSENSVGIMARNGIPDALVEAFKKHEHLDEETEHSSLPVRLLEEHGAVPPELARALLATTNLGIDTFELFLRGILRRYTDWNHRLQPAPLGVY
jgi:hypothetical protein